MKKITREHYFQILSDELRSLPVIWCPFIYSLRRDVGYMTLYYHFIPYILSTLVTATTVWQCPGESNKPINTEPWLHFFLINPSGCGNNNWTVIYCIVNDFLQQDVDIDNNFHVTRLLLQSTPPSRHVALFCLIITTPSRLAGVQVFRFKSPLAFVFFCVFYIIFCTTVWFIRQYKPHWWQ